MSLGAAYVWAAAGMGMEKRNMATVAVSPAFLLPVGNRRALRLWTKVQCSSVLVLLKYPNSQEYELMMEGGGQQSNIVSDK